MLNRGSSKNASDGTTSGMLSKEQSSENNTSSLKFYHPSFSTPRGLIKGWGKSRLGACTAPSSTKFSLHSAQSLPRYSGEACRRSNLPLARHDSTKYKPGKWSLDRQFARQITCFAATPTSSLTPGLCHSIPPCPSNHPLYTASLVDIQLAARAHHGWFDPCSTFGGGVLANPIPDPPPKHTPHRGRSME